MRLSIDITPEQHQFLKAASAIQGKSIKNYILMLRLLYRHMNNEKMINRNWLNFNLIQYEGSGYLEIASRRILFAFSILGAVASMVILPKFLAKWESVPFIAQIAFLSFPMFFLFALLIVKQVAIRKVGILFGVYLFLKLAFTIAALGDLNAIQGMMLIPLSISMTLISKYL